MTYLPKPYPATRDAATSSHFLVVGLGNELRGDDAVGPLIAATVASWQIPSVTAVMRRELTPTLIDSILSFRYIIFVEASSHSSCASTVQLAPIVVSDTHPQAHSQAHPQAHLQTYPQAHQRGARVGSLSPDAIAKNIRSCQPTALMKFIHRAYGTSPQTWLLTIPIEHRGRSVEHREHSDLGDELSATAKRGVDRALTTIEQFLKTYQSPALAAQALQMQPA